jgi:plastocyanin
VKVIQEHRRKTVQRELRILLMAVALVTAFDWLVERPSQVGPVFGASQPAASQITIDNFSFSPATLTVSAGATVSWINHDDIPHTVVSEDKLFKSHALDTDDKFSFTCTKPGSYPYYCGIHPKMTGKIVVQ